jgi:hypothetical protein
MSLLLDKTGHFVRIQRNREDGLQINPHDFLLYSVSSVLNGMGKRGIIWEVFQVGVERFFTSLLLRIKVPRISKSEDSSLRCAAFRMTLDGFL